MKAKKVIFSALTGILWSWGTFHCNISVHAQEHPKTLPIGISSQLPTPPIAPLQRLTLEQLKEAGDPLRWEHHRIRRLIDRNTYQASEKRKSHTKTRGEQESRLWRIQMGNSGYGNWSPYPDRALDARNISYPLPKNSKYHSGKPTKEKKKN